MSAEYLSTKATTLESTTPVPPAQAQAAQIPLQSFNLPTFPSEAFTAGLGALILTSDIKLDEYTNLLEQPFSVPDLPNSIKSLTLELFSLGYPPGFLVELGKKLQGLKSITIYSQLLSGTTGYAREDAVTFFRYQIALTELHLLDVFGPAGFWEDLQGELSGSLRFLECNYTYRHSDPEFYKSVPSKELVECVKDGLVALTLSISSPDVTEDEDDREGTEEGIRPAGGKDAKALVEKLISVGKSLVMVDVTMYEITLEDVGKVLDACEKVKILSASVDVEKGWEDFFGKLGEKARDIEVLEIVGVPGVDLVEKIKDGGDVGLSKEILQTLGEKWKELKTVKVSILRTKAEQWAKEAEVWEKKV